MPYRIIKRAFGTSSKGNIRDIDIPYEISDFCFVPQHGFLISLKDNHCISHLGMNGVFTLEWLGAIDNQGHSEGNSVYACLDYPSSISYNKKFNKCLVIERGGASVRKIDLQTVYISDLMGPTQREKIEQRLSKFDLSDVQTASCMDVYGAVYWTIDKLHTCYFLERGAVRVFIGSGKSGYSVASDLTRSSMKSPCGVMYMGDDIYISDTGNHCIRKFTGKKFTVIEGSPVEASNVESPSRLFYHKNVFYFLDGNQVKYYSPKGSDRGVIHESDNVIDIDVCGNDLLILEKIDA